MNNTTRTYHRTMAQAFGPYTDNLIYCTEDEPKTFERCTRLLFLVIALAVVFVLFI